ncbi:MAG: shikimate kinase [Candidatus Zixiibacteriota bacterium]
MTMAAARRHLFLAGFMGTGKSAVGHQLAARLHRPFVDLDGVVESLCRRTIPEVFRVEGEAAFRNHEARALRLVLGSPPSIIALGGGAPTVPVILAMARQTGRTVLLTADWAAIWDRVRDDLPSRPLLAGTTVASGILGHDDPARREQFVRHAESLLQSRRDAYDRIADLVVDTSRLTIPLVVERIMEWLGNGL